MTGIYKQYSRLLRGPIDRLVQKGQSAILLGPRQVGKTTLIEECLKGVPGVLSYLLQDPETRERLERDPGALAREVRAATRPCRAWIDEAQKVPELFDAVQLLIDEGSASFLLTGSSARKLRGRGANLLPGRVKMFRLDPLSWAECGWLNGRGLAPLAMANIGTGMRYSFQQSLVFGTLPGIAAQKEDAERADFLKAYSRLYLEEEIRAEALSRKIGAFSRFLELAACESGSAPNMSKLSMEAGVSVPAIKGFYGVLEDTLVVERVEPYLKNARKRLLSTPRYYFFDIGVRNALARLPLTQDLARAQKGLLFEHAVVLEILRRVRALNRDDRVCYWRTAGGAEVDCVLDTGAEAIPIEIKASAKVGRADISGLAAFLRDYPGAAKTGLLVTQGLRPETLTDKITAVPWNFL